MDVGSNKLLKIRSIGRCASFNSVLIAVWPRAPESAPDWTFEGLASYVVERSCGCLNGGRQTRNQLFKKENRNLFTNAFGRVNTAPLAGNSRVQGNKGPDGAEALPPGETNSNRRQ